MADQSDVETALVTLVAESLYPQGTEAPSVPGPVCRVYRGWPLSAALEADLAGGRVNIAIAPVEASLRLTTRFPEEWVQGATIATHLSVKVLDGCVYFSGTADPGQLAGVLVDGSTFVYRTEAGDTPELVAAQLAAQIREQRLALYADAVLSVPGAARMIARVVADQPAWRELRRQMQDFRIACFCPDPITRDTTAATIDIALATHRFIDLPDSTAGRLLRTGGTTMDRTENALLYRRDLFCGVEYATIETVKQPSMLFGDGRIGAMNFVG